MKWGHSEIREEGCYLSPTHSPHKPHIFPHKAYSGAEKSHFLDISLRRFLILLLSLLLNLTNLSCFHASQPHIAMRLSLILPTLLLSLLMLSACRSAESAQSSLAAQYTPHEIDSLSSLRWNEAQSYLDAQKYRKAEKALNEVIRLSPSPEAYSDRAFCHLKRKQYTEAHNDLRIAMADSLCNTETYHYCHNLLPKVQGLEERSKRRRARVGHVIANVLWLFAQLYLDRVVEEQENRRTAAFFNSISGSNNKTSSSSSAVSGSNERRPSRGGDFK